jgi:hypothetical protein
VFSRGRFRLEEVHSGKVVRTSTGSGLGSTFKPEEETNMAMEWTDVESSQIVRIGYDAETLKAQVAFKDKRSGGVQSTYEYDQVGQDVIDRIINSDSVGRAFAAELKYGFNYRRL